MVFSYESEKSNAEQFWGRTMCLTKSVPFPLKTEKDMVEMKQTYEDRILSITTNSEALFAEAVSNSEKSLASVTSLYEKQVHLCANSLRRV